MCLKTYEKRPNVQIQNQNVYVQNLSTFTIEKNVSECFGISTAQNTNKH